MGKHQMALSKEQRSKLSAEELLDHIDEEAAEVIQAACKLRRFGPKAEFEGVKYDNVADLLEEFRQLRGFVTELGKRLQRGGQRTRRRVRTPRKKA